jgi:hypothetical protein
MHRLVFVDIRPDGLAKIVQPRNYLAIRHPDGALMLLNCYLSFPSAKVARDCLINSANSRL